MIRARIFGSVVSAGLVVLAGAGSALAGTEVQLSALETTDTCAMNEACVDEYLFALYERAPKIDTVAVTHQEKVAVKRKGKTRIVTRTFSTPVEEDFSWKDEAAAEKAGMSLMQYVIDGMDPSFKLTLYYALHAMDTAGLEPGITSAFRDDYRQSIASGHKAQTEKSYHGGSLRGGYGHGLAVDLISVNGETREQQLIASQLLWKWIDTNGADWGIGRPYLNRDAPHVGPIDGQEFTEHRGGTNIANGGAKPPKHARFAQRGRLRGMHARHALVRAKRHHHFVSLPARHAMMKHLKSHEALRDPKRQA